MGLTESQPYNKFSCLHRDKGCPNFVWQNGAACGACIAEGRHPGRNNASDLQSSPIAYAAQKQAAQIALPVLEDGFVGYIRMDMEAYKARLKAVDGFPGTVDGVWQSLSVEDPYETMEL